MYPRGQPGGTFNSPLLGGIQLPTDHANEHADCTMGGRAGGFNSWDALTALRQHPHGGAAPHRSGGRRPAVGSGGGVERRHRAGGGGRPGDGQSAVGPRKRTLRKSSVHGIVDGHPACGAPETPKSIRFFKVFVAHTKQQCAFSLNYNFCSDLWYFPGY